MKNFLMMFLLKIILFFMCGISPIVANVTNLTTCSDIDNQGRPLNISDSFSPQAKHIFVSGHLNTVNTTDIHILWYYQNTLMVSQKGKYDTGYFFASITPGLNDDFPYGDYKVEVRIGGALAASTKFRVE